MTARERADKLVAHIKRNPHKWIHEFSLEIEQAINAAVEEEREACAKIGDEEARERLGSAATADRNSYKDEAHGYRMMATQAQRIVELIRRRPTASSAPQAD